MTPNHNPIDKTFPLDALINHSNDCIHIIHENGDILYVNDTFCERFKMEREELILTKVWNLEKVFANKPERWYSQLLKLKEVDNMLVGGKLQLPKGQEKSIEASLKYIKHKDNGYVIAFTRDITERYEIEKKLHEKEKKIKELALLPEEDPNPTFRFDLDGNILYCNKSGKKSLFEYFQKSKELKNKLMEAFSKNSILEQEIEVEEQHYSISIVPIIESNYVNLYAKNITQLKKIESELIKLSTVASKTDNGVIITDKSGKIEWVNQSFLNTTKYILEEVVNKKPGNFLQGKNTNKEHVEQFKKGLASKKPFNIEILNYDKYGKEYWCSCNITPILNDEGETLKFISLQSDITQKKKQEQEFAALYSRMNTLMESLQDGVMIENEERKISLINQTCCDLFNIPATPETLLGADCAEALDQLKNLFKNPDEFVEKVIKLLKEKKTRLGDEIEMKDGRILERDYIPIYIEKNYKGHLWRYKDITTRKLAENRLREQKNFLETNFKQQKVLSEISFELNRHDISFNEKIDTTLIKLGEFLNFSRVYIFENDFDKNVTTNTFEWCNVGINPQIGELQEVPIEAVKSFFDIIKKDGLFFSQNISALPQDLREILEPQEILSILIYPIWLNGQFIGHIGFDECVLDNREWTNNIFELLRTISNMVSFEYDRKKFNDDLIASQKRALEAAKAKENFLANMSHEIRTPMNAIIGMSGLLKETNLNKKQVSFLNAIKTSADNLLVVLNDILDFSKIEAGKLNVENIPFLLSEVTNQVIKIQGLRAAEKSIILEYNYDDKIHPVFIGDPYRLNQILLNLLSNAIKFTEQGTVKLSVDLIEAKEESNVIAFTVKDTGIGIKPEMREKIFEGFMQQDSSITRKFGGSGLGLAITKELIELFNGEIQVDSNENKGSTFTVTIELKKGGIKELQKGNQIDIDKKKLQGKKILLVEDNELNQFFVLSVLESWESYVEVANNGKEALNLLETKHFDIVLMDIQMPVMNGIEATQKIRESKNNIPVIALTANVLKGDKDKYLNAGMNDYVGKPIETANLYRAICKALDLSIEYKKVEKEEETETHKSRGVAYSLDKLGMMAMNNPDFKTKMIKIFIQNVDQGLKEMYSLLEAENFDELGKQAHKLKSSIDTFSIEPSMTHIRILEKSKETNKYELKSILKILDQDLNQVVKELKKEI